MQGLRKRGGGGEGMVVLSCILGRCVSATQAFISDSKNTSQYPFQTGQSSISTQNYKQADKKTVLVTENLQTDTPLQK